MSRPRWSRSNPGSAPVALRDEVHCRFGALCGIQEPEAYTSAGGTEELRSGTLSPTVLAVTWLLMAVRCSSGLPSWAGLRTVITRSFC